MCVRVCVCMCVIKCCNHNLKLYIKGNWKSIWNTSTFFVLLQVSCAILNHQTRYMILFKSWIHFPFVYFSMMCFFFFFFFFCAGRFIETTKKYPAVTCCQIIFCFYLRVISKLRFIFRTHTHTHTHTHIYICVCVCVCVWMFVGAQVIIRRVKSCDVSATRSCI